MAQTSNECQLGESSLTTLEPSVTDNKLDTKPLHPITIKTNHSQQTACVNQNRQSLAKLLHLRGYMVCKEALVIIEDFYTSNSNKYESMEEFINKLNRVITFETTSHSPVISQDLAHTIVQRFKSKNAQQVIDLDNIQRDDLLPDKVTIRIKNVQCNNLSNNDKNQGRDTTRANFSEFAIHYEFLFKKLTSLPIFQQEDFQLTKLATLTASSVPSIRCICFGLLIKDLSKIDGYLLIDATGRVPVRITPDTTYRNKIVYLNCLVLVEGVYINPDDMLYAANIGLPPILLDPLEDKSLACRDEQMVVVLKEMYLDDEHVCNMINMLFTGYDSMETPPALFILIGDFSREPCIIVKDFYSLMKKFIKTLRLCDNLKECHFVLVPGPKDSCSLQPVTSSNHALGDDVTPVTRSTSDMPKPPITKEQIPINLLHLAGFKNVHLATNPTHIYFNDRLISVVCHSYIKELRKNLLYDMSDHNEELFDVIKKIILSNGHLAAGVEKTYHTSMNLWQRPDLLILADTDAFGNKYDFNLSNESDTSFMTVPSFSRQSSQFKVYYLKTGEIEESQVSSDVLEVDEEEEEEEGEVEDNRDDENEVVVEDDSSNVNKEVNQEDAEVVQLREEVTEADTEME